MIKDMVVIKVLQRGEPVKIELMTPVTEIGFFSQFARVPGPQGPPGTPGVDGAPGIDGDAKVHLGWFDYVTGYRDEPVLIGLGTYLLPDGEFTGEVYRYAYLQSTGTDKELFRFVSADGMVDAFFEAFDGTTFTGLAVKKLLVLPATD